MTTPHDRFLTGSLTGSFCAQSQHRFPVPSPTGTGTGATGSSSGAEPVEPLDPNPVNHHPKEHPVNDTQKAASRRRTMRFYALTRRLFLALHGRGWIDSHLDDTLRSRVAHALGDWKRWYDWGHPAMWLVGRNDSGNSGRPRGRDLWWIPTMYVEGIAASLVADLEVRRGCYVTREYAIVRATGADIDWRIFDLQDDGLTVVIGLWPNRAEHNGRIQPLPWGELKPKTSLRLFLEWYLVDHKLKAQWLGLRSWIWSKALHAAVHEKKPFGCNVVPTPRAGGYSHWHCELRPWHRGDHRFRNYTWSGGPERVEFAPQDVTR